MYCDESVDITLHKRREKGSRDPGRAATLRRATGVAVTAPQP